MKFLEKTKNIWKKANIFFLWQDHVLVFKYQLWQSSSESIMRSDGREMVNETLHNPCCNLRDWEDCSLLLWRNKSPLSDPLLLFPWLWSIWALAILILYVNKWLQKKISYDRNLHIMIPKLISIFEGLINYMVKNALWATPHTHQCCVGYNEYVTLLPWLWCFLHFFWQFYIPACHCPQIHFFATQT